MIQAFSDYSVRLAWPFWALELNLTALTVDIEYAFNSILNQLKFQISGSEHYQTPYGSEHRDEFLIRQARAILIDPQQRLVCEFWYISPDKDIVQAADTKLNLAQWKQRLNVN